MCLYKDGNVESGRTKLNSIITEYPKRTDIISIYLDMEIKFAKKQAVRQLFDRLLARKNVKLPQLKFVFKRFLEFEMSHGSEKEVEKVKKRAQEMLAAMQQSDDESESEDE